VITGWRRFSERLGGGASIFQDLDMGEALSAEAKLRPTEGGGKHPTEAKSLGKSSAEDLKRREMPPPPRDQLRSFSKARDFEGYAPKPSMHFEIFPLKTGPNLKPKGRALLSMDRFVQTCHRDSPHYPLIVTKLLPPEGLRFGGLSMPGRTNSSRQPATNHRLQTVVVESQRVKPPISVGGYPGPAPSAQTKVFA